MTAFIVGSFIGAMNYGDSTGPTKRDILAAVLPLIGVPGLVATAFGLLTWFALGKTSFFLICKLNSPLSLKFSGDMMPGDFQRKQLDV